MWFFDLDGISEHLGILQSAGPKHEEMLETLHLPKEQPYFEAGVSRNLPSKNSQKQGKKEKVLE